MKQREEKDKRVRQQDWEPKDRQQVYDDNISQYELNPDELERSKDEEKQERMRRQERGRGPQQ